MLPQRQLLSRSIVVAAFGLSCFLILVFLWQSFGGPLPLRAQGYRVSVEFDEAATLAEQAEVRRSGVPVGRVVSLERTPGGLTQATIQLDPEYVPVRADTRAMLRTKSLGGETYVEISPGSPDAAPVPDRGRLPRASVEDGVQLDEILRTFDARTRANFKVWFEQQAIAGAGRGREVNEAIAQFAPLTEQATTLLATLDENGPELRRLVRNTGTVFGALSAREEQLRGLIRSSDRLFETTGARNRQLAATFEALPAFQRESRALLRDLEDFAGRNEAQIVALTPTFRELSRTAEALEALAPDLRRLVTDLGPLQEAGVRGLPAGTEVIEGLGEFTRALPGPLTQLNPFLAYVSAFRRDLMSFAVNVTAASQAGVNLGDTRQYARYLRTIPMLGTEQLARYPQRLASNRTNPYPLPDTTFSLDRPIPSIETRQCTGKPWPEVLDGPGVEQQSLDVIRARIGDRTPIGPPCIKAPLRNGKVFPQLGPDPTPSIP